MVQQNKKNIIKEKNNIVPGTKIGFWSLLKNNIHMIDIHIAVTYP